ncbi:MAG: iron hydrogenase small subunit [Clostridia bacterium]|nr:iron hydrogenase small subunit [Clostridia bacterium]
MVNVKINEKDIAVKEGTLILDAAKLVGVNIPTLCYLKDINEIGACRVCVVEIKGQERLATACNTVVSEGMEIITNSAKVRTARKTNVELILSQHDGECTTCVRSGNCSLQTLANDLDINERPFGKNISGKAIDKNFPLVRDEDKCIKCMRCINVCDKIQKLGVWDLVNTGSRTNIGVHGGVALKNSNCSLCGQCITHCPTGALKARDDVQKVLDNLGDEEKMKIIQIAPAVRVAWGEEFGLDPEFATEKRLVAALKKCGFNYVFDTDFAADLTIMEEGHEFIERLPEIKKSGMPMFTSCCPGWIRYIKGNYPELVKNLSTAKSPQQMFGAVSKTYYADLLGVSADKIYGVSAMPCVAKKHEAALETMKNNGISDVDAVLTTREITRLIRSEGIDVISLKEEEFDSPLGLSTGAAVIFGTTGGVMEAALRSAYYFVTKTLPPVDAFYEVRGMKGWKEAKFDIAGTEVKVAVSHGLKNTDDLIKAIKKGTVQYDFVEVMACPGGCAGGGGQPIHDGFELAEDRGESLRKLDKNNPIRFSHENPAIQKIYEDYFEKPLSHKSHELLHTDHEGWNMPK